MANVRRWCHLERRPSKQGQVPSGPSDDSTTISDTESVEEQFVDKDCDQPPGPTAQKLLEESLFDKAPLSYGLSSDYQLVAGAFTRQGRKSQFPYFPNQDVHLVVPLRSDTMMVAIFVGHGLEGHRSACCVRDLFERRAQSLSLLSGWSRVEAFEALFRQAQQLLIQEGLAHYSGTTATVAMIDIKIGFAFVAHVGDSTLAVTKGSQVIATTKDHRVDQSVESRVVAHGGEVRTVGTCKTRRICARGSDLPGLAMARCLGDQEAHGLGASCEPEFNFLPFCSESTLVVASDGVWDVLSPKEAAFYASGTASGNLVEGFGAFEERCGSLARTIVDEARRRCSTAVNIDDITALIVKAAPLFCMTDSASAGSSVSLFELGV